MSMIICPEAAKKAQMEIDEFVGRDRLPDYEDRDNLPYIDCILKETLRFVFHTKFLFLYEYLISSSQIQSPTAIGYATQCYI